MKDKTKEKVKCPHCNHVFLTKSKMILTSCGSCGRKFNKKENLVRQRGQKELEQ